MLSGTASDGTEGLRAIKAENGITFAQDPESAKFGEMPRSAIDAGVVDYALAIPELARELVRLSRHPYVAAADVPPAVGDSAAFKQILVVVRSAVGVDFSEYKPPTLRAPAGPPDGAAARGRVCRTTWRSCEREPDEVRALYEDILIHVTSFFRDPEVFETLESQILPAILTAQAGGGADSHLGGRVLHRRRGLLARDRAARVPGRLARAPFRSSAPT